MKILLNVLWISLTLVLAGCGGQSGNSNVTENADQKAKAEYEAMIKAQEEAESAAMKSVKPAQPAKPGQPAATAKPGQPAAPVKPAQPAKPTS